MKNAFVAFERHTQGGKLFTDSDGCVYLKPHSHELLAGREFANEGEVITVIRDNNNDPRKTPFAGEVVILNIKTF